MHGLARLKTIIGTVKTLSVISLFLFVLIFSNDVAASVRYDYAFDISPSITKEKMFSAGLGLIFSEYNAWFNESMYLVHPETPNISMRNMYVSFMPFFEVRPFKFLEIGIAPTFIYKRHDARHDILNTRDLKELLAFDAIHGHVKVSLLNWYLSIGIRTDVDYSFFKYTLPHEILPGNFNASATLMLAVVPRVIPFNLLINYRVNSDKNLIKFGDALLAIEMLTSHITTLSIGTTYIFPYTKENNTTYIEPFVKFGLNIGDFMKINLAYKKIVWGINYVPNTATFTFSIEYMFYTKNNN